MEPEHRITFGPFCLELEETHGRLWRGEHIIALRPRSLAVLRYLVEHAGRLVTKAELRQQVWTRTHVTDTVGNALFMSKPGRWSCAPRCTSVGCGDSRASGTTPCNCS